MILIATDSGLIVCEPGWQIARQGLTDQRVTSVIARAGVILAGTPRGVFRSDDAGRTWAEASRGLAQPYVRWLAYHPAISDFEVAGCEPASIFISRDGAETWQERPEVAALRQEHAWYLPYSPGAGCVRGFAFHGARLYAAVEVGGLLRSDDFGASWRLAGGSSGNPDLGSPPVPFIHPDVHSLAVHPSSPDLVDAATGGGFYRSTDGGQTWRCLYVCYCRAAWTDPLDPRHILLGPAKHVERGGRIEESRDGGETWGPASSGQDVPWPDYMVERFVSLSSGLAAVLSNGQLLLSPTHTWAWQPVLPEISDINAITAMG
jgi:hypothetical protein